MIRRGRDWVRLHLSTTEVRQDGERWNDAFSAILQLIAVFVLSVILFSPLFFGLGPQIQSSESSTAVSQSFRDAGISDLIAAAMGILLPVMLDNLLDLIFLGVNASLVHRSFFLLMLFLSFLGEYVALRLNYLAIFFCCSYILQLWVLGCIALLEMHRVSRMFSWPTVIVILSVFYAYCITFVWFFTYGGSALFLTTRVLKYISFCLFFIVFLLYIGVELCTCWTSDIGFWEWYTSLQSKKRDGLTVSIGVFITLFIYLILALTLNSTAAGFAGFSVSYLYGYLTLCIICSVFITVLPQRLMKIYALKMNADLELKKTFVRYISHELRTPLSIALSGIDLLEEQVREGASLPELLSTTTDIRSPCRTGVEILNELLDFEKLDSGLTVMDKTAQDPVVFVQATLTPFNLVARQKNIDLRVTSKLQPAHFTVDIDETKVIAASLPIIAVTLVTIGFAGVPQHPLERL